MDQFAALAELPPILYGGGAQSGLALAFLFAAGVVVFAGTKLSSYGDALGERTGLGSGLVGLLFLAAVTSLPELVVSTTSTIAASMKAAALDPNILAYHQHYDELLRGGADLAIGNMIGSNVFNLMLFVIMDFVQGRTAFLSHLSRNHIMSAASGLGMLGILLFGFAVCSKDTGGTGWVMPILKIGPFTPILFIAYIGIMTFQGKLEKRSTGMDDAHGEEASEPVDEYLLKMPAVRFYGTIVLLAAMIVAGGMWLSVLGERMSLPAEAGGFGLGESFIGTIFLAISTSLPELVVCVASVRMGCYNMAAGNVLGSNIFNLVIVFTADIGLRGGSILHYASMSHLVTMGMVMILTSGVIAGIVFRSRRSLGRLSYETVMMLVVYICGNIALYFVGAKEIKIETNAIQEIQHKSEDNNTPQDGIPLEML